MNFRIVKLQMENGNVHYYNKLWFCFFSFGRFIRFLFTLLITFIFTCLIFQFMSLMLAAPFTDKRKTAKTAHKHDSIWKWVRRKNNKWRISFWVHQQGKIWFFLSLRFSQPFSSSSSLKFWILKLHEFKCI